MSTSVGVREKTDVAVKSSISQDQSQKLVQTMITMCFGCLAFLRGLFPDDNFVDQKFVPEKCNRDYDKNNASSIRIKTLVRDKTEEADLFLDWLENGVFQSLKKGYLKAISLGIFVDECAPNDLIETYLFSFEYCNDSISISINGQKDTISLLDSRKMVQQLMRRFIIITQSLDPLPEKRFLTMRLMFNDSAPKEYQPKLFKDSAGEPKTVITVPQDNSIDTFSVGALNTSVHNVGIKVLSLTDNTIQEQLISGNTIQIDPFDLLNDDDIQLPLETPTNSQVAAPSQTTKMLQTYLKSSPVKFHPTQALYTNDSNPDMPMQETQSEYPSISTFKHLRCLRCNKMVLATCYGNHAGSSIPACLSCLSEGKVDMNSLEMKRFTMTRNIYRYMARKPAFPSSVSYFYSLFFGETISDEQRRIVDDALSVLLVDGVFVVESQVRLRSSGAPLRSSGLINVDSDSILYPKGTLHRGTYAWYFNQRAPSAHVFYTEPFAKTTSHLLRLLEQSNFVFENLRLAPHEESLNLQKLSITEDVNSKRPFHDTTAADYEHDLDLDTQNLHHDKIRKISISKKTLKSPW